MAAYGAVVTTGIYCRPGCGAKPKAENLTSFDLPAAAEAAGYRACLKCRPYRSPIPVFTNGPEIVCRAVRLILGGALDNQTEADLAAHLAVSARHLRRLFADHVGVTPDGLARSARTHFARRLLDDTDLSFADIAFHTGFGSVRQFNRSCVSVFRMTPTELRARRRKTDRLVADGGLPLRLAYRGTLDFQHLLARFAREAIPGVEAVADGTYRRTIELNGQPGVLELSGGGSSHLILRLHLPYWGDLMHLVDRARRLATLDFDLDEATRHLSAEPVIVARLAASPGVRPLGCWDPFETGVQAIIRANGGAARTRTIARALTERFGGPVPGLTQMGLTHTFPSPAVMASASLDGLGLSSIEARSIAEFAGAVMAGEVRLDGSMLTDTLLNSLLALDGITERIAHVIALRSGETDAHPGLPSAGTIS